MEFINSKKRYAQWLVALLNNDLETMPGNLTPDEQKWYLRLVDSITKDDPKSFSKVLKEMGAEKWLQNCATLTLYQTALNNGKTRIAQRINHDAAAYMTCRLLTGKTSVVFPLEGPLASLMPAIEASIKADDANRFSETLKEMGAAQWFQNSIIHKLREAALSNRKSHIAQCINQDGAFYMTRRLLAGDETVVFPLPGEGPLAFSMPEIAAHIAADNAAGFAASLVKLEIADRVSENAVTLGEVAQANGLSSIAAYLAEHAVKASPVDDVPPENPGLVF